MEIVNSIIAAPHFDIPFFGRREHFELISRIWLVRDSRSIFSTPFPKQLTCMVGVHFFSQAVSSIARYIHPERTKEAISWESMHINHSWLTQQSAVPKPFYLNPKLLQIALTSDCVVSSSIWSELAHYTINTQESEQESEQTIIAPIFCTPEFLLPHLQNEYAFSDTLRTKLSMHHLCPIYSSVEDSESFVFPTSLSYEPTELSAQFLIKQFENDLHDVRSPFSIIPIDLCDEVSINFAVWAYHTLLYHYNNNCSFPPLDSQIIIILFNRTLLDTHIVSELQVHQWFEHFPYRVDFISYNSAFPLPHVTELDQLTRTLSTLSTLTPPSTNNTTNNSFNKNENEIIVLTDGTKHGVDSYHLEQESANINLATQLDQIYISHYAKQMGINAICKTKQALLLPSPRPFIQSSIRYPFPSMVGKPIELGVKRLGQTLKVFVPNQMKHWCCFDKLNQNPIHTYNRSKLLGVLNPNLIALGDDKDTAKQKSQSNSLVKQMQVSSSYLLQLKTHGEIKYAEKFPPTTESIDSSSYNVRQSHHHCTHLRVQFFQLETLSTFSTHATHSTLLSTISPSLPENRWTPQFIAQEIGSDIFEFLTMPFLISPPTAASSSQEQTSSSSSPFLPHHTISTLLTPPSASQLPIYYINQSLQYLPPKNKYHDYVELKDMSIAHYSTTPVVPIHQYSTPYQLYQYNDTKTHQIEEQTSITGYTGLCASSSVSSVSQHIYPKTTVYYNYTTPNNYFSTTYIDSEIESGLRKERTSLLLDPELEESPLLSTYSQQTFQALSQLFSRASLPSSSMLPPPSHSSDQSSSFPCPPSTQQQPIESSTSFNQLTYPCSSSSPTVTPLSSSPHHFHVQLEPFSESRISQQYSDFEHLTPFHHLLTYTVVDYSVFLAQIRAIEKSHNTTNSLSKPSFFSLISNIFNTSTSIRCSYMTQLMLNAHNSSESNSIPRQGPSLASPRLSTDIPAILSNQQSPPLFQNEQLEQHKQLEQNCPPPQQTIHTFTRNIPSNFNHQSTPGYKFLMDERKARNFRDRSTVPHFFIVIDDSVTNPEQCQDFDNASYLDTNRPLFLSKEAAIMQSYLSHVVPLAFGMARNSFPIHYAFIQLDQLKDMMVNCMQYAIAMRMSHYFK